MTDTLLIKGARVIDGTGAPWFPADVLVERGRIAAIGPMLDAPDAEPVEAQGRFLAAASSTPIATTT